jgi:hypothetical protein
MTRNQFNSAMKWYHGYGNVRKPPKFLRDRGLDRKWRSANDRDGPTCMVVIKDEKNDTTVVTGRSIDDKNVVPADKREGKKYEVEYMPPDWRDDECYNMCDMWSTFRVDSVTEAWKKIKSMLKKDPDYQFGKIKRSYTYAKPTFKQQTKKAQKVKVEAFGVARC